MRATIGRIATRNCTRQAFISSSPFSTFSGGARGGSGRGRGRGGDTGSPDLPNSPFAPRTPGKSVEQDAPSESIDAPVFPSGLGHGRGKPIASDNGLPTFSSGVSSVGRGRPTQPPQVSHDPETQSGGPKKPIFFRREDFEETVTTPQLGNPEVGVLPPSKDAGETIPNPQFSNLGINLPGLSGAGRGKPAKVLGPEARPGEENRHMRRRPDRVTLRRGDTQDGTDGWETSRQTQPKLSREEAAKRAMGILSKGDAGRGSSGGRGKARGRGGRGGRGRGGERDLDDSESDGLLGLKLGSDADAERFAERVGPEVMAKLNEAFDEMSSRVLPSPVDDAYLDALHTNNMIEYEPEYLVEFDNPDIDEKPPIPLRDALEKMKPFLIAYEGIKSQEEWEESIEDLMERVPAMKELIDFYCGPDRVTAKQQQQELQRVANTLPDNVPASVRQFADRAVLSLQSNPGWGWDKKCQFMDKLVGEVSQQHK